MAGRPPGGGKWQQALRQFGRAQRETAKQHAGSAGGVVVASRLPPGGHHGGFIEALMVRIWWV